jgi:hypothetical protein
MVCLIGVAESMYEGGKPMIWWQLALVRRLVRAGCEFWVMIGNG